MQDLSAERPAAATAAAAESKHGRLWNETEATCVSRSCSALLTIRGNREISRAAKALWHAWGYYTVEGGRRGGCLEVSAKAGEPKAGEPKAGEPKAAK